MLGNGPAWMLTSAHMALTYFAKFLHYLPMRRNAEVSDAVLDSPNSLII